MKAAICILLLTTFIIHSAYADDRCGKAACAEVKQKIRNIEARMRSGYTRAQGERYEARLRELKAKRRKLCH